MKILIIEDENPAFERISRMLNQFETQVDIIGNTKGIKDTVEWFSQNKEPDLLLLDVQLSDGISLEIFEKVRITCPVIFTTAYDEYILDAFNYNGIDYLLKPIKREKLFSALEKYDTLKEHFAQDYTKLLNHLGTKEKKYKVRITVRNGSEFLSIRTDQIAYFYTEYKLVFIKTFDGKKYLYDKNLTAIESELEPCNFFRINRNYIASIESIKNFKSFFKGKLIVELSPRPNEKVYISQEKASLFKSWIEQ